MRRPAATEALLAQVPLFKGLARAEIERLGALTARRSLRRGEVLFRADEPPSALYALVYGRMRLTVPAVGGRERVVEQMGPGRSFGEAVLFLGRPSLVSAAAAADSLVLEVPKAAFLELVSRDSVLALRVIAGLAQRIERLVRDLHGAKAGSGTVRFVAWLLRRRGIPARGEARVKLAAPKAALAAQLNLSPEHFSRILRALSKSGLIAVHAREIAIPEVERLRAFLSGGQGSEASNERAEGGSTLSSMDTTMAQGALT